MPSFTIKHETKLSALDAFQKVQDYLKNSEGLKKLGEMESSFDEKGLSGHVKGSQFEVKLKVSKEASTVVALDVSIGFMLTPFKSKIQETLQNKMTKVLG